VTAVVISAFDQPWPEWLRTD